MSRVRDLLQEGTRILESSGLEFARLDAERLLLAVTKSSRVWLLTHPDASVSDAQAETFRQFLEKRANHYPLQYLEGRQEFFGRPFIVDERVLIPRPETELLVETSIRLLKRTSAPRIIDVGTGSGCIAVTLACERPDSQVFAGDTSAAALEVARVNAQRHGVANQVSFRQGRSLEPFLGTAPVNLIISNPPYVADGDSLVEYSVRRFEPAAAVFSGPSGIEVYREILGTAPGLLLEGAPLVIEIGFGQRPEISRLAEDYGWSVLQVDKDLAGIDRCVVLGVNSSK
jgi:release factor glutamine methyltransferase